MCCSACAYVIFRSFRDFLDWKGLVLTEPTAQTHGAVELGEYEKQRQARMEANQDMLMQLGLA